MTSLFSRLQKLNKEANIPRPWRLYEESGKQFIVNEVGYSVEGPDSPMSKGDQALTVEAVNSLPAVLNLIEAAQYAREQSQQLIGMDDPFGSQGPPILIGANAWFELADAVAVFVSGQEEPK